MTKNKLEIFKKANLVRKRLLAKNNGFNNPTEYLNHLEKFKNSN